MAEICAIRCTVRKGIFDGEYVVSFKALDEDGNTHEVEAIVYADSLELDETADGKGRLKAYKVGAKGSAVAVVLPQSTLENGPAMVVPKDEVEEVAA